MSVREAKERILTLNCLLNQLQNGVAARILFLSPFVVAQAQTPLRYVGQKPAQNNGECARICF